MFLRSRGVWFEFAERCLRLAWQNPENIFFTEDDCHPSLN